VSGTLLSGLVALSVALPLALGGAIHLTEFSSAGQRRRLRQVIDIVAAVPPIVYAVFALLVVIPAMRFGGAWFGDPSPFNVLGAGAVVGLMLTPLLMALTADALASVPKSRREAAYALGARPFQAIVFVVIPAAAPTIVGGVLLTGSRAVGEMVILFLIGGHQPVFALDPTAPAETLTGYLLGVADGQFAADSIASQSMFAVGLVLFVVTFISNLVGIRLRRAAWHTRAEV
jgi:phosphate transport system permease protein